MPTTCNDPVGALTAFAPVAGRYDDGTTFLVDMTLFETFLGTRGAVAGVTIGEGEAQVRVDDWFLDVDPDTDDLRTLAIRAADETRASLG